jgi:hypothetical protein
MDFWSQLQQSGIAKWVHQSDTIYSYPLILFLHTLSMGLLVGINAAIDLRILGFAPEIPIRPMEKAFFPMWVGFAVNAATGSLLFMSDAVRHVTNPAFFVKLAFIALAITNLKLIRSAVFRDPLLEKRPVQSNGKILAATSLAFWLIAITAGRLMAYVAEFVNGS